MKRRAQSGRDAAATSSSRRSLIRLASAGAGAALMSMVAPAVRSGAWAGGSDRPEKTEVKIGFIPLTDCASVVIASVLGFDRKHGIRIVLSREASWAAVRDKLASGELDAAHALYGLIYGVHLGVAGPQRDMAVLMGLNQNGQAITLSHRLRDRGVTTGEALARRVGAGEGGYTFAHTFPTGTHAMWLYYWLAAHGIHPVTAVGTITIPPPQMVPSMGVGHMDGCCVGEPWNNRAIFDGVGFTAQTSQGIWKDHPEKVLGASAEFVRRHPNTARAMIMALLEASRFIDTPSHRRRVAGIIAEPSYVDCPVDVIDQRLEGRYEDGLGRAWVDPDFMKFHADGAVNFPYLSDGMWFMTQHRRWGLLREDPDYLAVASQVNQVELYRQAASRVGVPLPEDPMRKSTLLDGVVWDGTDPRRYAGAFPVSA